MPSATVLGPSEGDKYFIVGDHGTFKIGPKETGGRFTVAHTYILPDAGPPPHVHGKEDEMFYLLKGTMMFMDNQHTFLAGPGSCLYLKRGIPHTFKNIGKDVVECVLTCLPSGFEAFVAECGQKVDKIPSGLPVDEAAIGRLLANCQKYGIQILPEHKVLGEKAYTSKPRRLWVLGHLIDIKLGSEDTLGNFSVAEITTRPGLFVPPHKHLEMDEYFYVVEGEFEFTVDGKAIKAPVGTFIYVPRGVMHGFANKTDKPAKLADFHTPGGFEKFFEECGSVCNDINETPPDVPTDVEQLTMMFRKHGMALGHV